MSGIERFIYIGLALFFIISIGVAVFLLTTDSPSTVTETTTVEETAEETSGTQQTVIIQTTQAAQEAEESGYNAEAASAGEAENGNSDNSYNYILNTNTGIFHYPDCESVELMNDQNKQYSADTRDEIINQGYASCQNCNP